MVVIFKSTVSSNKGIASNMMGQRLEAFDPTDNEKRYLSGFWHLPVTMTMSSTTSLQPETDNHTPTRSYNAYCTKR